MIIRRRPPGVPIQVANLTCQLAGSPVQPANILEKIVWHKEEEVEQLRQRLPLKVLRQRVAEAPPPRDFLQALRTSPQPVAIIAEVKKASPSKGILRADFDPVAIAQAYARAGASCLSVLTDETFFQGSGEFLRQIRQQVALPILCKEFILSPYQILWARSLGADAILLIAAILSDADLRYFLKVIQQLGMTALVEVHTQEELERVLQIPGLNLIGINNRDLTSFQVDLETTRRLASQIRNPALTLVSESGIDTADQLKWLHSWGVRAALIGEALVKARDPGLALAQLLQVPV
ncbi:MAG: indole-3-glycerol phosphate synthase TrpC [Thermostichales cyanobacterium BF4_bins_65]